MWEAFCPNLQIPVILCLCHPKRHFQASIVYKEGNQKQTPLLQFPLLSLLLQHWGKEIKDKKLMEDFKGMKNLQLGLP